MWTIFTVDVTLLVVTVITLDALMIVEHIALIIREVFKSTNTMHRTKFERRTRIGEGCQKVSIIGGDGENAGNEYRYW